MNTELMNKIITPKRYFEILKKRKEDLTPEDKIDKDLFENFIESCEKYINNLSPVVATVYAEYQKELAALIVKEKKTDNENGVLINFQRKVSEMNKEEQNINNNVEQFTRKLTNQKAGYIDATIVLVMILNIGFIIAMAILGSK